MTIAEGLHLKEEWALVNRHRIEKAYDDHDTISDTIMNVISDLRMEELGDSNNVSEYEKKLVMAGFHLAQEAMQRKQDATHHMITKILTSRSGKGGLGDILGMFDKED